MTFKHKLSRRLAAIPFVFAAGLLALAACDAAPSAPNELIPSETAASVTSLPASTARGSRVIVLTRAKVYSYASLYAPLNASQWPGATGTIVEGPSAVTSREPIALWRVDFTTHPDGWVRGDQIALLSPPSPAPAPVLASLSVSPTTVAIDVGATSQLAVTFRDSTGNAMTGPSVTYASASTAIATVSSTGLVRGVAAGTVEVSATSGGVTGLATVTVRAPVVTPPTVASVTLSPTSIALTVGATSQLTAVARDASGNAISGQSVTFASLNSAVATVSTTGLVRGIATGTVLVSATAAGASASASVSVTAAPVPPPVDTTGTRQVVWSSDWSTAVGTASGTITDFSRWSMLGGQGLDVISSSGLGFPTTNVLRVTARGETTGYAFLRRTGLPIPAVGQSNFYRWYFRATMPDGLEDQETHPFQDGNAASQANWLFHVYHDAGAGRWRPQVRAAVGANSYPNDRWSGPVLQKHQTYRFEVQIQRTGTNTFRMNVRIYDQAGTLLHGSSAFTNQSGTATLASNPTFNFLQLASLEGLNAGNNGIAGSPVWGFVYGYQAGIAVCRGDWCGAYRSSDRQ